MNEKVSNTIDEINRQREVVKENLINSDDVKAGKCTPEEELQEPSYILYDSIARSTIEILKQPIIDKSLSDLAKDTSDNFSKSLVELLAVVMTQSAHQAILCYDELLKNEISKNFDLVYERLNSTSASVESHKAVLKVFKASLNEIESKIKIYEAANKKQ